MHLRIGTIKNKSTVKLIVTSEIISGLIKLDNIQQTNIKFYLELKI